MSFNRSITSLAVVGVGLIGSSILLAVKEKFKGVRTIAYDVDSQVRRRTLELGLAAEVTESLTKLAEVDLVVVCVPSSSVSIIIKELSKIVKNSTVVTDVASVKSPILRSLNNSLPNSFTYVPGHPMAGGENSGPDSGVTGLFENKTCFITPVDSTREWAVDLVEGFWHRVGAFTYRITPEAHDNMVALSSHLPHLMAFALMEVLDKEFSTVSSPTSFIGGGLREQIRLGKSNTIVWTDIFQLNSKPLLERLKMLEVALSEWRQMLSDNQECGEKLTERLALVQNAAKRYSVDSII